MIERARTDAEAFGALYDLYFDRVYKFCFVHVATPEDAEDRTHETFVRAFKALMTPRGHAGGYEDHGRFSAWLFRLAANVVCDAWRGTKKVITEMPRQQRAADGDQLAALIERLPDTRQFADVERWVALCERAAQLHEHIALLSADYQLILRLRYWEDRSWSEIAGSLNPARSEGAAKKLAARAREALSVLLRLDDCEISLQGLPPYQQIACRYRYIERLDIAVVANRMGRSISSVESLLDRALKGLAEGGTSHVW